VHGHELAGVQIGREYFAPAPWSDIWLSFDNLPDKARELLWAKHHRKLACSAGIPLPPSPGRLELGSGLKILFSDLA
jgi:hypothetical protein